MNGKVRKTVLLVLSCASLITAVGYSSWAVQAHKEYSLNNHDDATRPVAYIVGKEKVKYTSIEKALDVAQSGDIVCVIPPTSGSITYEIKRSCSVPSGVTLVLPTSKSTFESVNDSSSLNSYIKGMIEVPDGAGTCSFAAEKNKKTIVKVQSGVTITNNGTIVIAGKLTGGNNNAGSIGQTAGDYCELILESESKIEQTNNSANLYCFGYLNESEQDNGSAVNVSAGCIYLPFVVNDYRGFGYSYALSQGGGVSDKGCSAFNRYEFPNVSSKLTITSSGAIKCIVNILVTFSQAGVSNKVSHETLSMVGFSSDYFIQLLSGSIFEYKFDRTTRNSVIEITDGCTIGNLAFKATVSGFTADMNTSAGYFPIPYTFSIILKSSDSSKKAVFNSQKQNIKFLPGSSIEVSSNCELKCKSIAIFSAFVDGTIGNGKLYKHSANAMRYPIKPGAVFKLNEGSTISADSLGGTIYCGDTNSVTSTSKSTKCNEPWSTSGGAVPHFSEYLEIREEMNLVPLNYYLKKKIYFFSNCFANNNAYLPKTAVSINGQTGTEISGVQKVLFADSISSCQMKFQANIYNSLYSKILNESSIKEYPYEDTISNLGSECLFGVINSSVSISSSNNGVNEFEVQSISIVSTQDKVDGKDPLYVNEELGLKATIADSSKIYNPTITWSSSNNSVATVDSDGIVRGVSLGKVTIYAECYGKKASYETEVIAKEEEVEITNIWLESQNRCKSNDLKGNANTIGSSNNGTYDFNYNEKVTSRCTITVSLKFEPEEGRITGVQWTYKAWGGKSYMVDPADSQKELGRNSEETIGGEKDASIKQVKIVFDGDVGLSPDEEILKCIVNYDKGKQIALTFVFDYTYTGCLFPTAKVLMADGTYKQAGSIKTGDMVISFNHETGQFEPNRVIGNDHSDSGVETRNVVHLEFSNGRSTDFIYEHGYFDKTLNKYVYLHEDDFADYINKTFPTYRTI